MKNKNLMNRVIMLFAFLMVTSTSFSQKNTAEDLTNAVFETIKNNDKEAFLAYCISEDRKTKMLNDMGEESEMEKEIKNEIKRDKVKDIQDEIINVGFTKLVEDIKKNRCKSKNIEFKGIVETDHQFEIKNLKCYDIKFLISCKQANYRVELNLFETKEDLFMFGFNFIQIK